MLASKLARVARRPLTRSVPSGSVSSSAPPRLSSISQLRTRSWTGKQAQYPQLQQQQQQQRYISSTPSHHQPSSSTPRSQIYHIKFNGPPKPHNPQDQGRMPGPWKKPGKQQGGAGSGGMKGRTKLAIFGAGCVGFYYVLHLEKVPDTDRWRFMNVTPEEEEEFAETIRESLKAELASKTLPASHPVSIHVRRVVSRILTASSLGKLDSPPSLSPAALIGAIFGEGDGGGVFGGLGALFETETLGGGKKFDDLEKDMKPVFGKDKKWEVVVVDDRNVVNAMASPGLIVVFTGILPVCQDEEGLAAVLSHEIGHIVARHTAERLSSQTIGLSVVFLLHLLGLDFFMGRTIQSFFMDLPNSRKQETEADLIGLRLMSRACYDPQAAPRMFERLGELESIHASRLEFFNTHPSSENRVKFLESHLDEGYSILAANPECARVRGEYEAFKNASGTRGVKLGQVLG